MSESPEDQSSNKSTQLANHVAGDQAGRDVIKSEEVNYHYHDKSSGVQANIKRLSQQYLEDVEKGRMFDEIIEQLQHYKAPKEKEFIGLEKKLEEGGKTSEYEWAADVKEKFTKHLARHEFSENAQKIYACLLGQIYCSFHLLVKPNLGKKTDGEISRLIKDEVIDPVQNMVGENVLELYATEINGMLYYLTGNCHIKWNA